VEQDCLPHSPEEPGHPEPALVSLENDLGVRVDLLNLGATLVSVCIPMPTGPLNAVLSCPHVKDYPDDPYYLGATVGRYANRIADARFKLDGRTHVLEKSRGQQGHCLHGGPDGFSRRPWSLASRQDPASASFVLDSPGGDQGFPGRLRAEVAYRLTKHMALEITFRAKCDAPTVINLANHAYFNLNGDDSRADDHLLKILAAQYTPIDRRMIPTGELRPVTGTVFDFRSAAPISGRLDGDEEQLELAAGFDHNFVLHPAPGQLRPAAELLSPRTGLGLRLLTTQPGLQLYTGQHLGPPHRPFQGICLEAQNFPNAPNTPGFPSAVLRPGEHYFHRTVYEFFTR
jgi:aldose 1-epimerase